jgi:hypothetical protein
MAVQLRVYQSPQDLDHAVGPTDTVKVALADLLPLVALAHRKNYLWLQDFLEDEVRISADLFEVLEAFRQHRPSA